MLIEFTAEEQERIQAIRLSYQPERERLQRAVDNATDTEERLQLRKQQQALIDRLQDELQAYSEKLQQERFKQIASGGAAGIIAHAKEQAPAILEAVNKEWQAYFRGYDAETINKTTFATMKGGRLYVNANHAAKQLREELQLHIAALRDNKEAQQRLFSVIYEAVEASPYTDSAEIKADEEESKPPLEVIRFRRSPITDITLFGLMNDKASARIIQEADLFTQEANGQLTLKWEVNQAPQKKDPVPVYMALSFEGEATGKLAKKLTAFDNAVYNAIADLFYYWHRDNPQKPLYITPQEIYRRMNGKQSRDGGAKPSAAQVKRICRSIDKMRHIDFYMDISEEIKAHYITLEDERLIGGYIKDYLLNCSEAGFYTEQGRRVRGYRINNEPIFYTYQAAKDHVLYLPFELLDTSAALSDSENVTEFKLYLLQQIFLMKSGTRSSRKILLSTIYSATGIQPPEERLTGEYANENSRQTVIRRVRKADRDKIEKLLDAWTAKKWIKEYKALSSNNKPVGKRQAVAAYEIQL